MIGPFTPDLVLSNNVLKNDDISCSRHSAAEISLASVEEADQQFCADKFYDGLDLFSTDLDDLLLLDPSNSSYKHDPSKLVENGPSIGSVASL